MSQKEDTMESLIEIVEKEIGMVVELEENLPAWKMPLAMGNDYKRIFDYLESQHAESVDAPYTRFVDIDWAAQMKLGSIAGFFQMFTKKWHYFVGAPASKKLEGTNDLKTRILPKKKYVKTLHRGSYRSIEKTYKRMLVWIMQQGLSAGNESFEFYLNEPGKVKKEYLETMLLIPLR